MTSQPPTRIRPSWWSIAAYSMLMLGAGVALWAISIKGATLSAPEPAAPAVAKAAGNGPEAHLLFHVLLALLVILLASRALGIVFKRFHQPAVIGEVVAGILLGPSLLGRIVPDASAILFPAAVVPILGVVAQVAVVLFMFLVGLDLDPELLRRRTRSTVAISHSSIVIPFLLGATLALWLYPRFSTSDVPFTGFALFIGISLSVTAFPVLARILTDGQIQHTRLGTVAMTCAAVDDVTAWCLLSFVVGAIHSRWSGAVATTVLAVAYIVFMLVVVRPLAVRWVRAADGRGLTAGVLTASIAALLFSSLATERIGIHAVFGAFLAGAVIPHDSRIARELRAQIEPLVVVLLLPAFFAFTGLRTQMGLLSTPQQWAVCGLIIGVASLGKFGGGTVAARLTGFGTWRESASVGVLMNTRGLMELVVLNIGMDLGVLAPTLFAMLVLMAVTTTVMTTPILQALSGAALRREAALGRASAA